MKKSFLRFTVAALLSMMAAIPALSQEIRHIVIFKYKASATETQIAEVTSAFKDLKNKIPGIVSFEYGTNTSTENLNKGFTHVYLVTFKNVASRDAYLIHADHKKFTDLLGKMGVLEEPFVIDFQPTK